jgi:hypothetical protein
VAAADAHDEIYERQVFGMSGQRKDLPPARGHGTPRGIGRSSRRPGWAVRLDVSRDVRDVRGCLRAQNRNWFGVFMERRHQREETGQGIVGLSK